MISRESIDRFLKLYSNYKKCEQNNYGEFLSHFETKKSAIEFVEWLQEENLSWRPIPTPLSEQQKIDLYNIDGYVYSTRNGKTYTVLLSETQNFELLRQALLVLMIEGYFHPATPNPSISPIPNQIASSPPSKESKDQKSHPAPATTVSQTPIRQWNNFMQSPLAKNTSSSAPTFWNSSQQHSAPLKLFSGTVYKLKP